MLTNTSRRRGLLCLLLLLVVLLLVPVALVTGTGWVAGLGIAAWLAALWQGWEALSP